MEVEDIPPPWCSSLKTGRVSEEEQAKTVKKKRKGLGEGRAEWNMEEAKA